VLRGLHVYRPLVVVFSFVSPPLSELYPLSLHDALPISVDAWIAALQGAVESLTAAEPGEAWQLGHAWSSLQTLRHADDDVRLPRSEEHTSELQSRFDLVCRLLLEKKKND